MKITSKHLRLISGFLFLSGTIIIAITFSYNSKHPEDPNTYGRWVGIGVMIIGLILLAPWIKDKDNK
jgi:uncharacterized protein YjeT (DUF2065 family)